MWTYVQRTGQCFKPTGELLAVGYSGNWDGALPAGGPTDHRNRPEDQILRNLGPIPVGNYTIGVAFNSPGRMGPVVMGLTFDLANQMFGRNGFFIHGDLPAPKSGTASDGCIVLDRPFRQAISDSADRELVVIAGPPGLNAQGLSLVERVEPKAKKATKKTAAKKKSTATKKAPTRGVARKSKTIAKKSSGHVARGQPVKKAVKAAAKKSIKANSKSAAKAAKKVAAKRTARRPVVAKSKSKKKTGKKR
ncbi:MAG: DUF2778 domain-containing protein [Rudaea sp.]|nr:DUF2778 domain-containing protein [Rudaea sp.]